MKKKYIFSGLIGFFAASYLLLNLGLAPSLITSVAALGASSLIFKSDYDLDDLGIDNAKEYLELLQESEKNVTKLKQMKDKIQNTDIRGKIININKTTDKIIKVLHKKPDKISSASKFLNYYLPVTIKILERYDEIEEQKLNSLSSRDFENKVNQMISNIEIAFDNQLNNLYNEEFIDTNAEIKVFEAMLKSDGLLGESINTKKDGDINE